MVRVMERALSSYPVEVILTLYLHVGQSQQFYLPKKVRVCIAITENVISLECLAQFVPTTHRIFQSTYRPSMVNMLIENSCEEAPVGPAQVGLSIST